MVLDKLSQSKGIVVAKKANYSIVEIDREECNYSSEIQCKNDHRLLCTIRQRLIHNGSSINVGDRVSIESIDWDTNRATISNLYSRKSFISKPPVANVTEVIVVISVKNPIFDFDQASRFLLTAEQTGLNVSLLLTKVDLITSNELASQMRRLNSWGYSPLPISIKSAKGLDVWLNQIKLTKLAVLCGPSGVGKSSLLNYLLPKASIPIGDLSVKLKRGRNTTRHVQLYSLGADTRVADTPGFNRPELKVDPIGLQLLFPEIRYQSKKVSCKFRNCLHLDEPGCVIETSWERYQQYRNIIKEMIILRRLYQGD